MGLAPLQRDLRARHGSQASEILCRRIRGGGAMIGAAEAGTVSTALRWLLLIQVSHSVDTIVRGRDPLPAMYTYYNTYNFER